MITFIVCWWTCLGGNVNVSKNYVNSLDIASSIKHFRNSGSGLSDDQIRGILMSMGVLSNLRYSDFEISPETENGLKDDDKCKKEELDSFNISLTNFLFNRSNGVSYVLKSTDKDYRHVKEFLEMFITKESYINIDNDFSRYLDKYKDCLKIAYGKYNKEVIKFVEDTKISVKEGGKEKSISVGEAVWGMFLMFYKKRTNLKIIN